MHIECFDAKVDQERLRACFEIVESSRPYDDPALPPRSFAGFSTWWVHGFASNPRQTWLATDDAGEAVGCYLLVLPERENLTMATCVLAVAPDSRRSGIGTQLLAHCAGQARLAGRSRLVGEVTDGSPGASFAAAAGAASGMAEVFRVLEVDPGLPARLSELSAEAARRATGYTLVPWLGATPDEYMNDAVRLSDAMADAPTDNEPEFWDADVIRNAEQAAIAAGFRLHSVAARHDQSGQLVALSQIRTDPSIPGWGFQAMTAVLPEHRGRRLGLLVKLAMLDLLLGREPDVTGILTSNAGPNDHMIAINEQLGFEVRSVHRSWELDLTTKP
jgi:GNAT superfamily N-acetyltransferase